MADVAPSVRRRIAGTLRRRGIVIREGVYARSITPQGVNLDNGEKLPAGIRFLALGVRPSTLFAESDIPTGPDGGLAVNRFLQSTRYPEIFGGGDCIHFLERPLDKVGVYAVRQNPVLFHNMLAQLEGRALMPFDPGGDYLLIFNLGGGVGVLKKRWLEFGGRPAFIIKDYIDRKFMRKFQALE
jgi:NADH dehydrogenase FAD-containing subunit